MIVAECKPGDLIWADLCTDKGIVLTWPGNMDDLAALLSGADRGFRKVSVFADVFPGPTSRVTRSRRKAPFPGPSMVGAAGIEPATSRV
jgi:hypothetical protein